MNVINRFHDQIISACLKAGQDSIPVSKSPKKVIAGWNDIVKPERDAAIFWHRIWHDCGSPREGTVADIRRNTRAKYHLAIRKAKRNKEKISAEKMAKSVVENRNRDFGVKLKR